MTSFNELESFISNFSKEELSTNLLSTVTIIVQQEDNNDDKLYTVPIQYLYSVTLMVGLSDKIAIETTR